MHLGRFQKHEYTCIDVWVLQNWLQVDQSRSNIDFFSTFKLIEIYSMLMCSQIVHIIVIICKNDFEHHIN
jgi:hypothetical protein